MKAKKKLKRIKHKVRQEKRRRPIDITVAVGILIIAVSVSGFAVKSMVSQLSISQPLNSASEPKAAIIDQLSLTCPNDTFRETAMNILERAGYGVDYVPGEEVTVELYRNLPAHGYDVILLRGHSAGHSITGGVELVLFTSEVYSRTRYVSEQLAGCVGMVAYDASLLETRYFGISPKFVQQSTEGRFKNTTIIMMGCDGLAGTQMAEAFTEKGAKAYIGWKESVSASHTDAATTCLLQHLFAQEETIENAVDNAMKEVTADPACENVLTYYPPEVGGQTIENFSGKI